MVGVVQCYPIMTTGICSWLWHFELRTQYARTGHLKLSSCYLFHACSHLRKRTCLTCGALLCNLVQPRSMCTPETRGGAPRHPKWNAHLVMTSIVWHPTMGVQTIEGYWWGLVPLGEMTRTMRAHTALHGYTPPSCKLPRILLGSRLDFQRSLTNFSLLGSVRCQTR